MTDQRARFQQRIEDLVGRFEAAVRGRDWVTRRYPKRLRDEARTIYEVPALYLQKGATTLLLDPIGDDMPGAEAAADLYLMPAYDPMASLYLEGGAWTIHVAPQASTGAAEPRTLSLTDATILTSLDAIAEHAVPSV